MNGWVEAPPTKKGLGCFARGCLILVFFGIVLALACFAGFYWGGYQHSAIVHAIYWLGKTRSIGEAPAAVPEFAASDEQIQAVQERWQDFEQKSRAGQPAEIKLTGDDINSLIAANRNARGVFWLVSLLFQRRCPNRVKGRGIAQQSAVECDHRQ